MTIQYMSPPASGLNNSIIANGRSYSSAPGVPIDVQSADVALLTANGWSPYNTTTAHAWPGPTDLSIRQAALDMIVAGGGTIHLPEGFITLSAPLPIASSIVYVGIPPSRTYTNDVPDELWTFSGTGTVLQGDGTFSAFVYNNSALGSVNPIFDGLTCVAIKDIGFQNFYRGIDMGAANAGSLVWSTLENLAFTNIQDWGVSLINYMHCRVTRIYTQDCGQRSTLASGIVAGAQYYGSNYPNASCSLGNAYFEDLFNEGKRFGAFSRFMRGIVFEVAGSGAILNEIHAKGIQSNRLTSALYTDNAVGITSGQTSIQVTDSTQWAVGQPVRFSSTANGFNLNQTYIIASIVDATHVTLSNGRANSLATAISPTGTGTMMMSSYGFPDFELACITGAAGVENSRFLELDVENAAEIGVYCEAALGVNIDILQLPTTGTGLVLRGCTLFAYSRNGISYDCDATSSNNSRLDGLRGLAHQRTLPGYGIDTSTGAGINFLNIRGVPTSGPDLTTNTPDFYINAGGLGVGIALGQKYQTRDTSQTLPFGDTYFNGSTGVTFTLPTIVTDTLYGSTQIGMPITIYNFSANSITLATSSSQTFNNVASYTSHTIAAQTICKLKAAKLSSGTLIWAISSESMVVFG